MELADLKGARLTLKAVGLNDVHEYEVVGITPAPAPAANTGPKFALWNQRDSRWASVKLGNSQTVTIGTDGCVVCSIAGMLNITPIEANDRLKAAGAFAAGSAMLPIAAAQYEKAFGGKLKHVYQSQMFWRDVPAGEMQKLKDHTRNEQPAMVLVDSGRQDGLQTHYMLCDGGLANVPVVYDSWFNEVALATKRYGKAVGNSPIYRFDLFEVI